MFLVHDGLDEEHCLRVEVTIIRRDAPDAADLAALAREEAERLSRLQHVNICPLFRFGEHDGWFYVTTPKMDGFSLSAYDPAKVGTLDISRVTDVMQAVALALAVGHFKEISHHNVCPDSVHVDARGTVRIKNYFTSRVVFRHDQHRQERDDKIRVSVSPHYISPEKAENGNEDRRGDVFSYGVLYYWLLTGRHPFIGANPTEIIYARIPRQEDQEAIFNEADRLPAYVPPPPPQELRPEVPKALGAMVMSMLHYYPVRRPEFTEIISQLNLLRAKQDMIERRLTLFQIAQTDTRDIPKMEKHGVKKKPVSTTPSSGRPAPVILAAPDIPPSHGESQAIMSD